MYYILMVKYKAAIQILVLVAAFQFVSGTASPGFLFIALWYYFVIFCVVDLVALLAVQSMNRDDYTCSQMDWLKCLCKELSL
jgi:hypothetical protein